VCRSERGENEELCNAKSETATFEEAHEHAARDHLFKPALAKCPNCHEMKQPHQVCSHCGYYKGRPAQDVK
jgi:large subunit ribosomal protein L32